MKKWFGMLLSSVLMISVTAACSSSGGDSSSSASPKTTTSPTSAATQPASSSADPSKISGKVRVIVAGGQLEDGIDPLTNKKTTGLKTFFSTVFRQKYPNIQVEVNVTPWENADAKMRSLLTSKDIDVLASGGFERKYQNDGLIRGIDDLLAKDTGFKPDQLYIKGLWENSVFNKTLSGVRFGLPTTLGQRMVIYDKKLFDDWGVPYLSEKPTAEEILDKAKKMTGKNPKTGQQNYGLYYTGNNLAGSLFTALTYAHNAPGFDGSLANFKTINWQLNTPNMVKVMQFFKDSAKLVNPAIVNNKGAENFGTDKNENAIYLDSNGAKVIADYKSSGKKDMINRFVPVLNIGPNGEGWVANDGVVMAKDAQNLEASWEVMKFMGGYDYQKYNYENFGNAPTLQKADFVNPDDVYLKTAMKIAEYGHTNLHDSVGEFFSSELNPAVNGFVSASASGKDQDINAFLEQLQKKAKDWSAVQK
ncbi:extracellular solute-binding protein [Paenibacillus sp. CC-CFT747]|nr:extracellular solute-binding protein [Paenibacillus sp. CC-CFT747]